MTVAIDCRDPRHPRRAIRVATFSRVPDAVMPDPARVILPPIRLGALHRPSPRGAGQWSPEAGRMRQGVFVMTDDDPVHVLVGDDLHPDTMTDPAPGGARRRYRLACRSCRTAPVFKAETLHPILDRAEAADVGVLVLGDLVRRLS